MTRVAIALGIAFAMLPHAAAAAGVQSTVSTAPDGSRTMTHTVVIDAPVKHVWSALTTADGWKRWATASAWQVSDRPRIIETSYKADGVPGGPTAIRQLFLSEVPFRSLSFRTIKAPAGFKHFETYRKVVNRVVLTPVAIGQTRVRFRAGPYPDTVAGRELFAFFEAGNRKTLENMADVLGKGARSRFEER